MARGQENVPGGGHGWGERPRGKARRIYPTKNCPELGGKSGDLGPGAMQGLGWDARPHPGGTLPSPVPPRHSFILMCTS